MLLIECPHCGKRAETEFRWAGEADIARPPLGALASDAEWASYLYFRDNPKGAVRERWHHLHGCRQWFIVTRNTYDHEIAYTEPLDQQHTETWEGPPARRAVK